MSNTHRIKQYFRHLSKAKGRHGVHSPFVYAFMEYLLKKKGKEETKLVLLTRRHKKLVNELVQYFGCRHILWLSKGFEDGETYITLEPVSSEEVQIKSEVYMASEQERFPAPDLLLIDINDPSDWVAAFNKYIDMLGKESIVLVNSIHQSSKHTEAWEEVLKLPEVKLSMDLYKLGLVLFREEFKERQHFLLKNAG